MDKKWADAAWDKYVDFTMNNRKLAARINRILKDAERDPFHGLGKPEPLTGNLSGWWSRRIDDTNRLVYRIHENCLEIAQCGTHYHQH